MKYIKLQSTVALWPPLLLLMLVVGGASSFKAPTKSKRAPAPGPGVITILYEASSSWKSCFLHYNPDHEGWNSDPGLSFDAPSGTYANYSSLGGNWYQVNVFAEIQIEFCTTNGQQWNNNNGNNFLAHGCGVYTVSSKNKVTQIREFPTHATSAPTTTPPPTPAPIISFSQKLFIVHNKSTTSEGSGVVALGLSQRQQHQGGVHDNMVVTSSTSSYFRTTSSSAISDTAMAAGGSNTFVVEEDNHSYCHDGRPPNQTITFPLMRCIPTAVNTSIYPKVCNSTGLFVENFIDSECKTPAPASGSSTTIYKVGVCWLNSLFPNKGGGQDEEYVETVCG